MPVTSHASSMRCDTPTNQPRTATLQNPAGRLGQQPAPVAGDGDGHHLVAVGIEGCGNVAGRDAGHVVLARPPPEENGHPDAAHGPESRAEPLQAAPGTRTDYE